MKLYFTLFLTIFSFLFFTNVGSAQEKLQGRWDLTVSKDGEKLPSWLEITKSGNSTLVGRFVYAFGSARPVAHVKVQDGKFSFSIPPQWEEGDRYMDFEGQLVDEKLKGTMVYTDGGKYEWEGVRVPALPSVKNPVWGAPKALFNGKDLSGWHADRENNQWMAEDGIVKSKQSGANLITDEKFTDFKLHIEFRYPAESNSGVYLRGRYEVQIADNKGDAPSPIKFGGIYGFLTPNENAAKSPGEWQAYDITLIGRRVSIVANGKKIITDQIIPGVTGGALDSNEGTPGPFFLQGDHGPVEYRNIVVTPIMEQ